ncbi:type III PLP-dependent enzyme [Paenibacillus kyungheensis]|uniref:Type III PLP-dependent enzyme n=1 Tax=Paenibacillus kyungheensis TaxID=1452732 RepID=A0AAX3M7S5_9BACL|nr:type III PLP-dependent enzyme [Paenibacillus kyungheensis]WCT57961.1 type III PLP-dependent enzyme [Paenibacillus kyungheensis]
MYVQLNEGGFLLNTKLIPSLSPTKTQVSTAIIDQVHKIIEDEKVNRSPHMISRKPVCAFIYDLDTLRQRTRSKVKDMPARTNLFYAVKANPDPRIITALAPIVDGFETASIGEVHTIRLIDPDVPIIFGGPGKKDSEIEQAIDHNVMLIHAESMHEIRRIAWIAEQKSKTVRILLRVNVRKTIPTGTVTMGGKPTQFGIDEAQIAEAIECVQSLPQLTLAGFHMHSVSNNLDAQLHVELVNMYIQLVSQWISQYQLSIQYVNAGGGFGICYTEPDTHFAWDTFIKGLDDIWNEKVLPGVELIFEPGRYLVAHAGYYASEVIDLKCNHHKHYAILRGGTHHFRLPVSWGHNQPFELIAIQQWDYPFERPHQEQITITLAGELCTPKDVLAQDVKVEQIAVGDIVLFSIAGAYAWTISHHDFLSHPHPDMIYIDNQIGGYEPL